MIKALFQDTQLKQLTIGAAVGTLVISVITVALGGGTVVDWILNLAGVMAAGLTTVLAFRLWSAAEEGETARVIWLALFLGFLLWTIGEVLWAFYELILQQEIPYPSIADVSWILGYIPLFIGLLVRYRSFMTTPERSRLILSLAVFGVLLGLSLALLIIPIVTYPDYEPLLKFLDTSYAIGDLTVAFGALLIVSVLRGGELSMPWQIVTVGLLVTAFADMLFSYAAWNEIYWPDGALNFVTFVVDIPYIASYLIIALGFLLQIRTQQLPTRTELKPT